MTANDKPDFRSLWDTAYAQDDYLFGKGPSEFVKTFASLIPQGSFVFLPADGEGRNSVYLAQLGHTVAASDYAQTGIDKAKKLCIACDVTVDYYLNDLNEFSWPSESYDAIVANLIQFASPRLRDKIFAGMKKAVKKGGLILLHGYNPKQMLYKTGGPDILENLYEEAMLQNAFDDFEIITLQSYDTELNEGTRHIGLSAMIDLIARRPI
jgi:SAM-dependent methyltransferase